MKIRTCPAIPIREFWERRRNPSRYLSCLTRWIVESLAGIQFGRYVSSDYADRYGQVPGETLRSYLPVGNATVLETTVDGKRAYELRADRSPRQEPGPRTNYSVRATLRPDGFVRSLEASYVRPHDGGRTNVTVTVEHTDLDATTVDPPDWVVQRWPVAANASTPWALSGRP
jgi:hypothetical protein